MHFHDNEGNCTAGLQQEEHRQQSQGRHFLLLCSTGEAAAGELDPFEPLLQELWDSFREGLVTGF